MGQCTERFLVHWNKPPQASALVSLARSGDLVKVI